MKKKPIFAASNNKFGYPGDIPAWGKPTPTLPNLKELSERQLFYFVYFFMKTR